MVTVDNDETSARIDKGQLRDLICQFLTEVCHHVGGFWYNISGAGQGTLGLLFGAQDGATFAEFLLLAGLAKTLLNEIQLHLRNLQFLVTDTCKITMPGIELQTRGIFKSGSSGERQSIHYLYVGLEVVDQTFSRQQRRQLQPKRGGMTKTTLAQQLQKGALVVSPPTEDAFQTARDAFMETNPIVKQALVQASAMAAARRNAEQGRLDQSA
jgi:hypothetical protein